MGTAFDIIETDEIDYSPIHLGKSYADGESVEWDFGHISHPSMLIIGRSGAGKTHAIKRLAKGLLERGLAVHIIDSHGDIDVDGFETFRFHYTSEYGINPFVVDPHPELGGPRATISQVTSLLGSVHRSMGEMQRAMLSFACEHLYRQHGIQADKPETWGRSVFDIHDLTQHLESTILSHKTGLEGNAIGSLISAADKMRKVSDKLEAGASLTSMERAELEQALDEARDEWYAALADANPRDFGDILHRIRSGFSEKGMQSLLILLRRIASTGVFDGREPDPSGTAMRYYVRGLEATEQVMLVETILSRIFGWHARNVTDLNGPPRTYIILDEVKIFSQAAFKNPMHILNRLQTEARKLGVALILAGQAVDHLPMDVLVNSGTTLLLPVHDIAAPGVCRKMGVNAHALASIQPRRDALVSVDGGAFESVRLWA